MAVDNKIRRNNRHAGQIAEPLIEASTLYLAYVLILSMTSALLLGAIYGYFTNNWTLLIGYTTGVVAGYTLGAATYAASAGITLGAAAAKIASVLTPWGRAILCGIAIGL